MNVLGYLLIIGALIGAVVLLVLCFRQRPEKTVEYTPVPGPVAPAAGPYNPMSPPVTGTFGSPPPIVPMPLAETAPLPIAKDQYTVYAFARETQVCVCPCCDGENNIYRDKCCICGYKFRRGGWAT